VEVCVTTDAAVGAVGKTRPTGLGKALTRQRRRAAERATSPRVAFAGADVKPAVRPV